MAGGNEVNIRITADGKSAIASMTAVAAAAKNLKSDLDSNGAGGGLTKMFDGLEGAVKKVGVALAGIGSAGTALGAIGGIAAAAAEASKSLLLLPAAISVVTIGMKTLGLAAGDFMDGMHALGDDKKFSKALKSMGDSAKDLAIHIKGAHDVLAEGLSETLFDGLGKKFDAMVGNQIPKLKQAMDGIAKSANTAAKSFMDMLSQAGRQADLKTLIGNSAKVWDELFQAVTPLSAAFLDLSVVGSEMLAKLSAETGSLAQRFADFIAQARETGQLRQWMSDGLHALGELGKIAGNVAGSIKAIWEGLSSGMGAGGGLEAVTAATERFQQLMESPAVQDGLKALGEMFKTVSEESGKVFAELMTQLGPILKELAPVVAEVAKALGETLVAALKVLGPILLDVAKWMNEHKDAIAAATPYILAAVVAVKALSAAYKAFKIAKGLTDGIKKLKEMLLLTGAREALDGVGLGLDALKKGLDAAAISAGIAQLAISAMQLVLDALSLGTKSVSVGFDFGTALDEAIATLMTDWDAKWTEFDAKVSESLATLMEKWKTWWMVTFPEQVALGMVAIYPIVVDNLTLLSQAFTEGLAPVQALWTTFWTVTLGQQVSLGMVTIYPIVVDQLTLLAQAFTEGLLPVQTLWTTFWTVTLAEQVSLGMVTIYPIVVDNLALLLQAFTDGLLPIQTLWTTWWTVTMSTQMVTALNLMQVLWTGFWTTFLATMTTNLTTLGTAWTTFWNVTLLATEQTAMASILADVTTQMAAIVTVVTASMEAMTAAVTTGMAAIQAAVSAGLQAILAETTTVWTAITAAVTAAMTAIQSAIETGLQAILSFWQTNWQTVYDFVKTLDWLGLGQAVVDGIRAGIEGGWAALESFVTTKAQGLLAAAKSAIGVASPSKDFRDQVGKMIPLGIAKGIERNQRFAVKAVERMQQRVMAAGVVAGFQAGDPRAVRGMSYNRRTGSWSQQSRRGYGGGSRGGWSHGWDRHRWGGGNRFPRDASVVAGFQMDDLRNQAAAARYQRGHHVTFGGDCDGAFANAFMKLHRTGRIQISAR